MSKQIRLLGPSDIVPANSGTTYLDLWSYERNGNQSDEGVVQAVMPCAGVMRKFRVQVNVAPGGGKSRAFTVRKTDVIGAGVDTALSVTLSNAQTVNTDTVNELTVNELDLISCKHVPTGTPAAITDIQWSFEFEATNPNQSAYSGNHRGTFIFANTLYTGAFSQSAWQSTLAIAESAAAAAGAITKLCVANPSGAIFASDTITINILVDGVVQDGTGGTVDTTIVCDSSTTITSKSFTLPVTPGRGYTIRGVYSNAGSFATANLTCGVQFTASTAGQSHFCGGSPGTLSNTRFDYTGNREHSTGWGNSESSEACTVSHPTTFRLGRMYVRLSGAPGGGTSWTLKNRENNADSGPAVTIANTATTGNDVSSAPATYSDGDSLSIAAVSSGSPANPHAVWGLVQFIGNEEEEEEGGGELSMTEIVTAWADAEGGPFSDDADWEGGYKEARILRVS